MIFLWLICGTLMGLLFAGSNIVVFFNVDLEVDIIKGITINKIA